MRTYALFALTGLALARPQLPLNTPPKAGDPICLGPGGPVPDPAGAAPRRVELTPGARLPGVNPLKKTKMRYGPYAVPSMNTKSVMGESGALWNCGVGNITKPAEEFVIIGLQAGLEYPDGTNANIDTGMWLHHMVSVTKGPGRWDPTCYNHPNPAPHFGAGTYPDRSERGFSSGNERTPISLLARKEFLDGTVKRAGYPIRKTDEFAYIVDLMNMNMQDKVVYLTMTYDYFEGGLPQDWNALQPVWFDADQCGTSEVKPLKQNGTFTISGKAWNPNFEGTVAGLGGHLHDGGVSIDLKVNNQLICASTASYAGTPEYIFKKPAMAMPGGEVIATNHISKMSTCYYDEVSPIGRKLDPSQSWVIDGQYDYDKFTGNLEADGEQSDIMAIAIMYVSVPREGAKAPKKAEGLPY